MDNVDPKYLESLDHVEVTKTIGGATGLKTIGAKNTTAAGTLQKNTVGRTIKQNNNTNNAL